MTREEAIEVIKEVRFDINTKINGTTRFSQALEMAIKALETLEEFEKAQIITGGRLNGRTYAYKCGLEDGKRKALEQEPILDKIRTEILDNAFSVVNPRNTYEYINVIDLDSIDEILDKYKAESEE